MAYVYVYYVLAVGQGTGTLVQVCEDTLDKPLWSAVIDLGSEGWKHDVGEPSAKFAAKKLKNRTVSGNVTLDAVILSHSDSDHINLLPTLLGEFSNPRAPVWGKPTLWVNKVWYGGDKAKYKKGRARNLLDVLNEYRPLLSGPIVESPPNNSSSLDLSAPRYLADSGSDAKIWLLAGNTIPGEVSYGSNSPTRSASDGYLTNTKSLVVGVTFGSGANRKRFIATGDATGLTIVKCKQVIDSSGTDLSTSLSVTLPHHGSATTTYDLLGLRGTGTSEQLASELVVGFANDLEAETISASAGERSTFRHPAIDVIRDFGGHIKIAAYWDPALKSTIEHFYTSFFPSHFFTFDHLVATWPSKAGWYSARTSKNVFTTDYFIDLKEPVPMAWPPAAEYKPEKGSDFKPAPPRTISWAFVVKDGGAKWEVERVVDTVDLSEQEVRWVEAALGRPLPPERFVHIPSAEG